jgi:hypothetical protein
VIIFKVTVDLALTEEAVMGKFQKKIKAKKLSIIYSFCSLNRNEKQPLFKITENDFQSVFKNCKILEID